MKEQLEAFLADLVAVCQKHGMAILDQEQEGVALVPWHGCDIKDDVIVQVPTPLIRLRDIRPDGPRYGFDKNGYEYEPEGQA